MFSNVIKKTNRKQKSYTSDNLDYRKLDKKTNNIIENIDDLVDNLLARINSNSSVKHEKVRNILRVRQRLSTKKLLSITIFFLLIFAVIASARSFVDLDNNSTDFVSNAVDDSSLDNSTSQNNNTVVNNQSSEHNINDTFPKDDIINVSSKNSTTQDNESLVNNESYDNNINDTFPKNDIINASSNKTVIIAGLNLTLNCDQSLYSVNETVVIQGTTTYNNSPINTSANILIICPNYNLSKILNISDGRFLYEFVPIEIGSYKFYALVSYLNESVEEKLTFEVLGIPVKNASENIANLYVWDATDYQNKFVGDQITFYANYSSNNQSIENASSLISFNIGGWTQPKIMKYSNGFYVYNNSFNRAGIHTFRVQCSASGFENKTSVSKFVISEVESNVSVVSIVDAKEHEQVYALPGTSFYIERIINGTQGLEAIFAPFYTDGLTIEKIEIINENPVTGKKLLLRKDISPRVFSAGKGVSFIERKIDSLLEHFSVDIKQLNRVSYSKPFNLDGSIIVRVWFRTPSWDDIKSGFAPSSGRISYLTFTDNNFDFESSTWWNSNWINRKLITINSSQVDDDLTNFPILINITDTDLRDNAQNDGDDIAFVLYSDNTTHLNHEIEFYNGTTGELYAWVNITSLSSSEDTKIWMYYNNNGCSSQQNISGVWDSNHLVVHHLNETFGTHYDSTSNGNNGTWNDVDGQGSQDATGSIDGANNFDGNDDYVSLDNQITFTNGNTLMFWAKRDDTTDSGPLGKEDDNDNYVRFIAGTTTLRVQDSNSENKVWTSTFNPNVWYYIAITKQSNLWEAYRNGASLGTVAGTYDLLINAIGDCYSSSVYNFDGIIDEIRISNTIRNASWINTTYNTITNSSTFISIESEEYNVNTSIDTISPYIITYSPFTITATGASSLDNVTLWYRNSTDNSTWWNSSFSYRKKITINSSQVVTDLINFPIIINITDTNLTTKAQNDGDDIAFTNAEGAKLNHEIEKYNNSSGELFAWVNVTSLSSSVDTVLYLYYGNVSCASQEDVAGTWDSDFLIVQHLNETYSTADDHYKDSTTNNHDGTFVGGDGSNSVSGIIDQALSFDGIDTALTLDDSPDFTTPNSATRTYEAWVKLSAAPTGYRNIIGDYHGPCFQFNGNQLNYFAGEQIKSNVLSWTPGIWYYVVCTVNGLTATNWYRDGGSVGMETEYSQSTQDPDNFWIGADENGEYFNGVIDEVRLSTKLRTLGWIQTCYNNQINSSSFYNIGNEETGNEETWIKWNNATNPDTSSPWSWNFDFPNGTGYYEFYSIGNKSGFPNETAPGSADAICYFNESLNTLPEIVPINPQPNGTTDVNRFPICQVWANDSDDDTLTVYWYENTTDSWVLRNTNNSISPGTIVSYNFTQFGNYSTTFWWKVAINDSIDNISSWFYFTTESIETSVDAIDPYDQSTFSLTINSTGNSDLDNVTLYYRWSEDNISWGAEIQDISIFEGFESGSMNSSLWDVYSSTAYGQNEVNNTNPHTGSYSWLMAVDTQDNYNLNELYTIYDFTGTRDINIEFWQNDSSDEETDAPASWSNHYNADVVSFTNDGTTWYEIIDAASLNNDNAWSFYTYNISSHPNFNPDVNSSFAIKFQQYDNWIYPNDGRLWDDIYINFTIGGGINWTVWNNVNNPDTISPWSWNFDFPNRTGYYEFYSIGKKSNEIDEDAPISADARCYNNPTTMVDLINPYNRTTKPITITATGNSDFDNVTLYYRWSQDNVTWEMGSGKINWSSELLTNPGFETGDTTGWTNGGGGTMTVGTDCPYGSQGPDGTYYAYWLQDDWGLNSYAYQNVSLDSYATHIDAGLAKINVTGWFVSDEYNAAPFDESFMNVRFFNASDENMSGCWYESGGTNPISQGSGNNLNSWTQYGITNHTIPVGARKVQIRFLCWEYDPTGPTYWDAGSAENFSVTVGIEDYNWTVFGIDSAYPWSWEFNFPNGTGYYEFYSMGNKSGWPNESKPDNADALCKYNRQPTITNEGPSNQSTGIPLTPQMNITVNDADGESMTINWYSNSSGSWQVFGTNSSVGNGTYHQTNINFSSTGKTYWWYVTVNDGLDTNTSATFHFTTTATAPPQVTSNASTGVEETNATLWGYLYDEGGESCTGRFEYGTTTSYGTNTTNQTVSEGEEFSVGIDSLTPGQIYHYRAYVNNTHGSDTGSDISFLTKPQPPTSFNVQSNNSTINFLTWVIGTGANTTYIERNTSSNWALGEGTEIYNGSAGLYEDSGLTQGTTYYYQAWSFANWTEISTLFQWSDDNASDSNKTNIRPTCTVISPINASIDLNLQPTCEIWANDTNGDTLTVNWYENTTESWVLRQTNNSVVANSTLNWTFTQANAYDTTYWWKVSINDTIDNVTFLYHFTTKPINTSVDTIIPYVVDTPPITITATNYTPADNVTLYYRWSKDNSTWGYHPMSIFEGFETGTQNTSLWNTYQTASSNARIQWNYGTARSGSYSCSMDDADTDAGDYSLNVIYTNYDFSGVSDINIDFWEREWGDESHNAPDSWTGWGNYDVVAFTNDGNTWYEIVSEGSLNIETFTNFQYNISADPDFVSPPNSSFAIAFQQYDNYQLTGDGRAWDDIYINFTAPVDNSTDWRKWSNVTNPDTNYADGWSWNFDFPNSTGFYEFYTIGNLSGSPNETAPSSADAICVYTITPTISNEGPANESIDIPVYPQLNITVNDTDAYPMTITWYSNSSGPWLAFGTNTSVYNGTYHQNNSNFSQYFTTFWWYVNVTDGFKTNTSEIFHFRTEHSTFIDIVPDQWDIGSTTVGNYNYSTSNFYFNLSNNGTTTLNIQIKASNATNSSTGAHWELNSTPGFDNYSLQYNQSGGGTWTDINLTYDTFVTNLAIDTWQTFDLNIYMATLSTKSDPLSITVTFRSVIA